MGFLGRLTLLTFAIITFPFLDVFFMLTLTKFSHWFQRLTGLTNFWWAKVFLFFSFLSLSILALNFYFPFLAKRTDVPLLLVIPLSMYFLFIWVNVCNESDERNLDGNREVTITYNMGLMRLITFIGAVVLFELEAKRFFAPGGVLMFKIINALFSKYWLAAMYFISIIPLPPGKSKIQQWKESFMAGTKKLIPASSAG